MISTLSIALNGLRIGADPLEIAVQGFLMEPEPTPIIEPTGGFFLVPVWPRHEPVKPQKRKNRDVCIEVAGCTLRTSASDVEAGEVCRIEVQGCTLSATCAEPKVRFSMSFAVVGCEEENELEVYLMAQAAMELMDSI